MLANGVYVSPRLIATWFINKADRDSGSSITHLKLQKLVYYAEAWFLANFDRSLTDDYFEAWAHGPVSPTLYSKYRDKSWEALDREPARALPEDLPDFLSEIFSEYGQFDGKKLEALTHKEDPWRLARGNLPPEAKCSNRIDRLLMRNFYGAKIGKKPLEALPH